MKCPNHSMPIFSNRTLAELLRGLPAAVRDRCQADLLGRLTNGGHEAMSAEWELFVLSQLGRGGKLALAPSDQPGVPDAIFQPDGFGPILVEVTALNDQSLEESFADDALGMLFYRAVRRLIGDPSGAFDVHANWPDGAKGLPLAGLPPRSQLHGFMKTKEVQDFVQEIASDPTKVYTFRHVSNGAATTVVFRPGARFSSGSASGFLARGYNEHNRGRLLRKLRKKVKQISDSSLNLPSVLVLCDADCRMLRDEIRPRWQTESAKHAISDFIAGRPSISVPGPGGPWIIQKGAKQQTTSINAVIVLSVEERWNTMSLHRVTRKLRVDVIPNAGQEKHRLPQAALDKLVNSLFAEVPPVVRSPINAKNYPARPENEGGGQISDKTIKLSLLAFQDFLSGHVSRELFVERNRFVAEHLDRLISMGRGLSNIRVVRDESGRDDDWVELEFATLDPRDLRKLTSSADE